METPLSLSFWLIIAVYQGFQMRYIKFLYRDSPLIAVFRGKEKTVLSEIRVERGMVKYQFSTKVSKTGENLFQTSLFEPFYNLKLCLIHKINAFCIGHLNFWIKSVFFNQKNFIGYLFSQWINGIWVGQKCSKYIGYPLWRLEVAT